MLVQKDLIPEILVSSYIPQRAQTRKAAVPALYILPGPRAVETVCTQVPFFER